MQYLLVTHGIYIAGAGTYGTSLKDLTVEDWDWLMNVNLRSVFICSQAGCLVLCIYMPA